MSKLLTKKLKSIPLAIEDLSLKGDREVKKKI